ncbi:MAG: hypothetical protein ACFHX7_21105 [Pseudomonadota bacterium]
MQRRLELSYHGSTLTVEFGEPPGARLLVNGLVREQASGDGNNCLLRLSTTVQTDYEWHEFVEALVSYADSNIQVQLLANKALLLDETCQRETKS